MDTNGIVPIPRTMDQIPVCRAQIYKLIDAGELKRVHIGRRAFITQASITEYLARLR
jgi:hypothetical protein